MSRAEHAQTNRHCDQRYSSSTNRPLVVHDTPNIVISRIFSAYFLRFPLISAANAEEESAFFGGSFGQNRRLPYGRKAFGVASRRDTLVRQNFYDDLYVTWQPYGFVCGVVTGLPARDSSNAALT